MATLSTSRIIDNMRDCLNQIEDDFIDYVSDTDLAKLCEKLETVVAEAEEAKDEAEAEEDKDLDEENPDDSDDHREQG